MGWLDKITPWNDKSVGKTLKKVAPIIGYATGNPWLGAAAGILGGGGSEVSLLVNELRQMRREMLGGLTAPVTMNWRKGEMHRAVAADGLHRRVI